MITLPLDWELYIEKHTAPLPEILDEIERQTYLKTTYPQMLSGKIQAGLLHFLIKLSRPQKVLEIGTFTGYATIAMASALNEKAEIDTVENNEMMAEIARNFIEKSPWHNRITLHPADAVDFLKQTRNKYDFVFLDADKENYPVYFELIKPLLNPGALWVTDNVLWSGKVLNPSDKQTEGIAVFNRRITEDNTLENYLLPVRDGLMLAIKK